MAKGRLAPEDLERVSTAELLGELRRRHEVLSHPPTRVAILGPPCVGKQTQAEALRRGMSICRLSAPELFEGDDTPGSADDRAVGKLVELIDRPQCRRGFVLEGFPQTATQAQKLDEVLAKRNVPLHHAIFLDAPEDQLLARCEGRLLHEASGRVYNEKFRPPVAAGVDDFTGDALTRPPHDVSKFQKNVEEYHSNAKFLKIFYDRAGLTRNIGAEGAIEDVKSFMFKVVRERGGAAASASSSKAE
eukprot:TRINITY_DN21307_c0_g1_i1.p1 TRINITY_DN21307_c0_g1~~TRINITY_DN21307_c0_g1_i1.p1  ORF type:complete len:264 (-),score=43.80 TRINITY_DN21307_c0_g1_i1:81-818(-)